MLLRRALAPLLSLALATGLGVAVSTPAVAAGEPALFVSEINPDNGTHTFTDAGGVERTSLQDNFEFFEVANTTGTDIDLAAEGYSLAYGTTVLAIDPQTPAVVPAGGALTFWLRYSSGQADGYSSGSPNASLFDDDDFRAHYDVPGTVAIAYVTGQAGMANGGGRSLAVRQGGTVISESHYAAADVGQELSAHYAVPAAGTTAATIHAARGVPTPGALSPAQLVPAGSEPEPGPTVPEQGPPPPVDPELDAPVLQITELAPDTANVAGADAYEFVELYNSSDRPIDFADFTLNYLYIDANLVTTNAALWPAVPGDPVIAPGQTLVLWVKNGANDHLTADDFNAHFGSDLTQGENLVEINSGGMANGGLRGIQVMTNTGHDISRAYYLNDAETVADQPIQYRWVDGPVQEKIDVGIATPGYAAPVQVPAGLVRTPAGTAAPVVEDLTETSQSEVALDFRVTDDHQVRTVRLRLESNLDGDTSTRQLRFGEQDRYGYSIPRADLFGKRWIEYTVIARDGEHTTTYGPQRIQLIDGEPAAVRLNRADGDFVNGDTWLSATAGQGDPADLELSIDGTPVTDPVPALEAAPMFAFEATNTDAFFRNGVLLGDEVLHVFDEGFYERTETVATEVPVERVVLGEEITIGIHAGTKARPGADPDENNDDFSAMDPRLALPDGRVLRPVRCAGAGEGQPETERPCPADPGVRINFADASQVYFLATFQIPADAFDSMTHLWDTTSVDDGEHTITATLGEEGATRTLRVDNTAPAVATTVEDGSVQRGAFTVDAEVSDDGAGVAEDGVTAKLDGKPVSLPHETSSVTLPAGEHTVEITALDNLGNTRVETVRFSTPEEQPTTELDGPDADAEVPAGEVTLRATPSDPEGDDLDVEFRRGFTFSAGDEEVAVSSGTTADAGIVDREALTTRAGLQAVTSETEFPYQHFTVEVPATAGDDFTARVHWAGRANAEAKVLMYVLSAADDSWELVDQYLTIDDAPTEFTLEAMVPAQDHVVDGRITVLVQHSEGFTTTGQSRRGDQVPSYSENGVTPRGEYDFTIGVMSDTQYYNETPEFHPHQLNINRFFLGQRANLNLQYVIHNGDIVDDWDQPEQWDRADAAYRLFDEARLPYGVLAGNHDVGHHDNDYSEYGARFGDARFADNPWFGGSHLNNRGHYDVISAEGIDFLMLYMGWGAGDEQIAWMNEVISRYPERKVWINLHEYILTTGGLGPIPQRILDEVVATNPNVFAVSSGHYHDAHTRTDSFDDDGDGVDDRTVYSMLFDYQGLPEGGLGYLRLLHFDNAGERIVVRTYSPSLDDFNADDPSLDDESQEFEIPYAAFSMASVTKSLETTGFTAELLTTETIGRHTAVASGTRVEAAWQVEPGEHGWYVETRDEYGAVYHSPVRTFTAVETGQPGEPTEPTEPGTPVLPTPVPGKVRPKVAPVGRKRPLVRTNGSRKQRTVRVEVTADGPIGLRKSQVKVRVRGVRRKVAIGIDRRGRLVLRLPKGIRPGNRVLVIRVKATELTSRVTQGIRLRVRR